MDLLVGGRAAGSLRAVDVSLMGWLCTGGLRGVVVLLARAAAFAFPGGALRVPSQTGAAASEAGGSLTLVSGGTNSAGGVGGSVLLCGGDVSLVSVAGLSAGCRCRAAGCRCR